MSDFFQSLSELSSQDSILNFFAGSRKLTIGRRGGADVRLGSKGSLSVKASGAWFDFSAGVGGRGLFSAYCFEHYQTPNVDKSLLADAIDGAAREFGLTHLLHKKTDDTPETQKRRAELQAAYEQRKQQEQQQREQEQQEQAAEIATEQARAAKIANEIYAAAMPAKDHPYITRKHIANISGLKEISGADLLTWKPTKKHTAGVVKVNAAARYLIIPVYAYENDRDALVNVQMIDDNGAKLFLYKGRKRGCYHYLQGTSGQTKGICEGYATADAVRQVVSHGLFVAIDAGNLRHVVKMVRERFPFAPVTIYADDDSHKHAANGKNLNPGLTEAKKAGRGGCSIAFPIFKQPDGANTTDFNDLLLREGEKAVKSSIRKSLQQQIAHPVLQPNQYRFTGEHTTKTPTKRVGFRAHVTKYLAECLDLITFLESRRFSLLFAPTGSGKTDLTLKLTGRVLVLFPTNGVGRQKARQYSIHYVAAGTQPNDDRIQFGTYDSILKFSADALAAMTIVIDEAHDIVHCADKDFRGEMLGTLYAQLQAARRVILLTSTPPELLDALFPDIESAVITSDADAPIYYTTRHAKTAQAALLAIHKAGQTTVFFRNHKRAARDLRDALVKAGFSVVCLDKQAVEEGDDDADELRREGRLTRHYDFVIITSYFAQGVDIYGVNVGAILLDADFPFYLRKQGTARFRDADLSGVEIAILERQARRDKRANIDSAANFRAYAATGSEWRDMYNKTIERGLFNADDFQTLSNIKGRVMNTIMRTQGRFDVNALGCAYLVNKDVEHAARRDIRIELQIMAGFGMYGNGLTETADDSSSEPITRAIVQQHDDRQQAVDAWLDVVSGLTREEIDACHDFENDRLLSACMDNLRTLILLVGRNAAVNIMYEIRDSNRRFSRIKRQIHNSQNFRNRVYNEICEAFPDGEIIDEPTKQARMREILLRNAALRKLYNLPKSSICHLSNNRITAILNDFRETLTHTIDGDTFTACIAYTPLQRFISLAGYFAEFSGEHADAFRKKFAEFISKNTELFPPEKPTEKGKTAANSAIFSTQENDDSRNVF